MSTGRQAAKGLRSIADDLEAGKLELLEWMDEAELIETPTDGDTRTYRAGPRRQLTIVISWPLLASVNEDAGEKSNWHD